MPSLVNLSCRVNETLLRGNRRHLNKSEILLADLACYSQLADPSKVWFLVDPGRHAYSIIAAASNHSSQKIYRERQARAGPVD